MSTLDNTQFTYDSAEIGNMHVETATDAKTGKETVKSVLVNDEPLEPTNRFWNSLYARFGFNKAFFKYFDHAEVFERIAEREPSDRIRICVERGKGRKGKPSNRLLAVSNPTRPIVPHDELVEMLNNTKNEGISYNDGVIESTHQPRVGTSSFQIAGDSFQNRFVMNTPIDGYGKPSVYLSMLREVCSNGMIGMAKTFKSEVSLGRGDDNVAFALTRVLDQFNNDEGYAALRQRIESATNSWASVNEAMTLYKLLIRLHGRSDAAGNPEIKRIIGNDGAKIDTPVLRKGAARSNGSSIGEDEDVVGSGLINAFHGLTGDVSELYGLANLDALSVKRQRTLPVDCKVYDLLNFATEVATHYAQPGAARSVNAFVGTLLANEYDMEGTGDSFDEFRDFHLNTKLEQGMTGSANQN